MTKSSSSPWRTILSGLLLGMSLSLILMLGTIILTVGVSPYWLMLAALIALIVAAMQLPRQRTFIIAVIGGGALGVVVSLAVIFVFITDIFKSSTQENMTAQQLEQWIGLDLPSSTTNLHSYAEGFQDWQVFVRFEIPKADVKEFLRINKLEPESNTITSFSNDDVKKDWWKPETKMFKVFKPMVKVGAETQPSTKTGFYPTIQISELEGDQVTVYISAFNT
jgi:hypothetical protein